MEIASSMSFVDAESMVKIILSVKSLRNLYSVAISIRLITSFTSSSTFGSNSAVICFSAKRSSSVQTSGRRSLVGRRRKGAGEPEKGLR